jgi:hypothetical protein
MMQNVWYRPSIVWERVGRRVSGVLLTLYSPITTSMEERERCYSFVLSQTSHEMSAIKVCIHVMNELDY